MIIRARALELKSSTLDPKKQRTWSDPLSQYSMIIHVSTSASALEVLPADSVLVALVTGVVLPESPFVPQGCVSSP